MTPATTDAVTASTTVPTVFTAVSSADEPELVAEDLIEEVSIDGMCGVY